MRRINVIGTSGSGKSTFSRNLAAAFGVPHIEMDALFWKRNWGESTDDEFFAALETAITPPAWVLDGNYHRTVPIKWREADTLIWIDYSFLRTLVQAIRRAIKRCLSQEELWPGTGNTEKFRNTFLSRNSVVWWTIKTYHSNRERYLKIMADPAYAHLKFIQLRSPAEAKEFILQQQKIQAATISPASEQSGR
ncbi:adenylate kinase (plasmid) [Photobacterium sp. GJ3]|uniref:adenylate kinase n=1 Tax=Photobacterium sp. GJ3 TaxID=2829502 RepID=UPI001B8B1E23|nr:adenylate kinase [Photobacterium sp. GJ3]QUJ70622.1 adenylate kinase [Photobacterium sp. GJ3]